MENILTPEEKKYLKKVSNYLNAHGMSTGEVRIDDFHGFNSIKFEDIGYFSNNYRVEIPQGLVSILEKTMNYINEKELIEYPDDYNYMYLEFTIDTESQKFEVEFEYTYNRESDTETTIWNKADISEDEKLKEVFNSLDEIKSRLGDSDSLELRYYGSGDSGYLESEFENTNIPVPADIEDWCYGELESIHGGWEINEGSQGFFVFMGDRKEIELHHTFNEEQTDYDKIGSIDFSQK